MMGTGYHPKQPEEYRREQFYKRANWRAKFAIWPRRCMISHKRIWLTYGYEGSATWTGPGDPIIEKHWHDKHEHIIFHLKESK